MGSDGRQSGRQVYVCTNDVEELLRSAALPGSVLGHVVNESKLCELLRRGEVGAVAVDHAAATPELEAKLRALRQAGVPVPLIELVPEAVTRQSLVPVWADALVSHERAHLDLIQKARRLTTERVLAASGRAMRARFKPTYVPDVVLCSVPDHVPPFGTIEAAARFGSCEASTLFRHWLSMREPANGLHLRVFMAWPLLLRGLALKPVAEGWAHVAARLGTTHNRLNSLSVELCGWPLDTLDRDEPLHATDAFERHVLEALGIELSRVAPI